MVQLKTSPEPKRKYSQLLQTVLPQKGTEMAKGGYKTKGGFLSMVCFKWEKVHEHITTEAKVLNS